MRILPILLLTLSLTIATGCATKNPKPAASRPAANVDSPTANLLLIAAVYGSGTRYADVTYRVNDLIHQPNVEFFARPEWLKADPTPGWNKALVITYEHKGKRRIFTCGEGGSVSAERLIQAAKN